MLHASDPVRCIAPPPEAFERHGVAVVRRLVDAERLKELVAAFDRLFSPTSTGPPVLRELVRPSRLDRAFADLLAEESFLAPASLALGTERLQLLQEVLLVKQPGAGGEVAWHRDASYVGYLEPTRVVSIRLALADCSRRSGCLQVLDGSHAWPHDGAPRTGASSLEDELARLPSELRAGLAAHVAAIELAPGDVSLHDCRLLHGSASNRSGEDRKTLVVHVFDADCRLVPSRLPDPAALEHFPTDASGHLIGPDFPQLPASRPR